MKFFSIFVLMLSTLPAIQAQAASAYESWCGRGYRADSYGRGIEAGFKGGDLRPNLLDAGCYDLGVHRGKSLMQEPVVFDCEGDFNDGYAAGFEVSPESAGTACYNGGYSAGIAALRVGAREGNAALVGSLCVDEYKRGEQDARERRVPVRPIGEPEATCYSAGNYDGGLFY